MSGRAYYNEFDPYPAQWLRNLITEGLIAPGDVDERSIADVRPRDLAGYDQCHWFAGIGGWSLALRLAGWSDDRAVWTGSCPCQPFSVAGKRAGAADARHLWPEMFRLVRECRPAIVFGEQVEGAVRHGWLDGVFGDMEGEGYACGAAVLGAHSVGAPHIRQRLWWVADAQGAGSPHGRSGAVQPEPAASGRDDGGLAVAGDGNLQRRRQHGCEPANGGVGGVEYAAGDGWQQRRAGASGRCAVGGCRQGFWSGFDLLPCTDGKTRRVEPGTFPLVDGSAFKLGSGSAFEGQSRVGMLRGYGNAINPPVAAAFIEAFMGVRP